MIGRVSFTTIDATDPDRLAAFWGAILGTEVGETSDARRFVFLREANGHVRVEDLREATDTVAVLGGSWDGNELSLDDARWRTLHDPEGNEFDIFVTDQ